MIFGPESDPLPSSSISVRTHVNSTSAPALAVGRSPSWSMLTSSVSTQPFAVLVTVSVYSPGELAVAIIWFSVPASTPGPSHKYVRSVPPVVPEPSS